MSKGNNKKKEFPLLSIAVLIWALAITAILLMLYRDVQEIKDKKAGPRFLHPSELEEATTTEAAKKKTPDEELRDIYE